MSRERQSIGYIAIDRRILDDPLFLGRPQRLYAFQWLVAKAAWKPGGQRVGLAVVEVQRGQLATTVRGLAEAWEWPPSTVQYFLSLLRRHEKILSEAIRTEIHTQIHTQVSRNATRITICNYNDFQGQLRGAAGGSARSSVRAFVQDAPQLPGIMRENTAESSITTESKDKKEAFRISKLSRPRQGARSEDGQFVWINCDDPQWAIFADDFQNVTGTRICPEVREGKRGKWFCYYGEAARPRKARAAR
jgi:hypothetical protein